MKPGMRTPLQISLLMMAGSLPTTSAMAQTAPQPNSTIPELSVSTNPLAGNDIDADTEARCFSEAVSLSGDTAWCDVLITALNAKLPPQPETNAALARSYLNRALLLTKRGEWALAEADLLAGLRLQTGWAELYLAMGNLRLHQGRFNEALERYNDAIERSSRPPPEYFVNRALALRGLGQIQLAVDDASRAAAIRQESLQPDDLSPSDSGAAPGAEFQ